MNMLERTKQYTYILVLRMQYI